ERILSVFVALSIVVCCQAHAATPKKKEPSPAKPIRTIGSVSIRVRLPFNSTPAAIKVFPREAYRDQGQPSLSGVLAQTPGALPSGYASLRGGLPTETAASIDGI